MIDFTNTKVAFEMKTKGELRNAKFLYSLIKSPTLVSILGRISKLSLAIGLPISWVIKPILYKLFVGGETIEECLPVAEKMFQYGVYCLLDYSVESAKNEKEIESTMNELFHSIRVSGEFDFVPYSVFKPTALVNPEILRKVNEGKALDNEEKHLFNQFVMRVDMLCEEAKRNEKPILVDAEDFWYQKAIDEVIEQMMIKYNKETAVVFNTLQMYRHDRLEYLNFLLEQSQRENYVLGVKYVRGAYMEKERLRAQQGNYPSPIYPTKQDTDNAFNEAIKISLHNIDKMHIFCGTHNEKSIQSALHLMQDLGIKNDDNRVFFSQLYGMSDNLSFNLAQAGYRIVKYLPYGKIKTVLPYLLRRAKENTAIAGQTGRELSLLQIEWQRRKKEKA